MIKKILPLFLLLGFSALAQQRPAANPALDSLKNEKDSAALSKKIAKLRSGTESDLGLLLSYYNATNQKKAEELVSYTVKRFPMGKQASVQATNAIFLEKDPVEQEKMAVAFKQKFPNEKTDMIDYAVSYGYVGKKNTDKSLEYLQKISDPVFKPQAIAIIAREMMNYDLKAAEEVIKQGLEKAKGMANDPAAIERAKTDKLFNPKAAYNNYIILYSEILTKKGNYKQALDYVKQVYDETSNKNPGLKKSYTLLMSKNGFYAEAFPELERIAAAGQADELTKIELQKAYTKLNPGKDVAAYLASFGSQLEKKYSQEAINSIIKEQSPDFYVTNTKGERVSLADFKGKTIILDFWATWCGPCKASFPAMQRLVNKYQSDKSIAFLFIHTWEHSKTPKQDAIEYLTANKYNMDLYMDVKDPQTKANPAVTAFKVSGIPAKFIIDGNGNIRFKLTGFSGGDDAAVAEVSAMIDLTKKQTM